MDGPSWRLYVSYLILSIYQKACNYAFDLGHDIKKSLEAELAALSCWPVSLFTGPVSRRTTLAFEHKQGMNKGDSVFADVKNKLEEICEVTKVDIRPQVRS